MSSVGLTVISPSQQQSPENEYFNLKDTTPTPSACSSPNSIQLSTPEAKPPTQTEANSKFLNYLNADFIDNAAVKQFQRSKNSRTKLTKIVDNFNYLNCADPSLVKQQQAINFLSSPTHSPVSNKSNNNSTNKKSTVRQLKKNSNDAKKPSLLLLMVQQNVQNLNLF